MSGGTRLRPYLAAAVIVVASIGIVLVVRERGRQETFITIEPVAQGQTVTVFVGGAVERPGVYTLGRGERVEAAIAAAGGFSAEADQDGINRALRLRDEGQVIVPRKGEARPTAAARPVDTQVPAGGAASAAPATAPALASGGSAPPPGPTRINVNTAPAAELEKLPGVGPRLAQEIVDYRAANGPFAGPADLAKVRGISERMVASWEALITFEP
jgi:competence protein ComEA